MACSTPVETVATAPHPAGPDREPDESLMGRYRDGDGDAFEVLYRRHRGPLYRYIRRQCATTDAAEEIFQDVWMRLVGARARYEPRAKFTTFLYRIAHHRVIDHHRRAGPRARAQREMPGDPADADLPAADPIGWPAADAPPAPDDALDRQRMTARLRAALGVLPAPQANAFLLHEEAGLSLEEIARLTGVGRETVKSRLRYALAKLRQALEG